MFENPEMDANYFEELTDSFRSPHLWEFAAGKWKLRNPIA